MAIVINSSTSVPENEIQFSAVRSAGPGGQNVNKVNSRMILEFDVTHSATLSSYQKRRIAEKLGRRINKQGVLRLQAQRHRTQSANRADLLERFVVLLHSALRPVTKRIPTGVPRGVREQRLTAKKQRSQTKRIRQMPRNFDES